MREKITDIFFSERERWFSWISVLFGMGIGIYFGLNNEPSPWWTLGIIEAFILIAILLRHSREALLILSIPAIVLLGFTYIQLDAAYIAKTPRLEGEKAIYVQGQITNVDYNSKQRQRITLEKMQDFAGDEIKGSYKITLMPYAARKTFQVGECVESVDVARHTCVQFLNIDRSTRENLFGRIDDTAADGPLFRFICFFVSQAHTADAHKHK